MQERLLEWYRAHGRELAWRRSADPYRILVSEVMLQQTQAARVEPAFDGFVGRFPTVGALAAAPLGDVLRGWQGLGYNRRAVALHRAAQVIVSEHGGRVPDDLAALEALPGVGAYTARAVLAFAFGHDAAPVDTNVARVLTRAVAGRPLAPRRLQALADELVPPGQAAAWSAALMDLGSAHCQGRAPRCVQCPLRATCAWAQSDRADPWTEAKPAAQRRFAGSDRYHRGRLLDALRAGPVPVARLASAARLDGEPERATAIADALVRDGLAVRAGGRLQLPA